MPRKTEVYGFNLFYHDEVIISVEDVNPASAYTGPVQPDPTNTLNYNFKKMEDLMESLRNGDLSFDNFRTVGDLEVGRDLIIGRYLVISTEFGIVLSRDKRPTPHIILDFADVLAHAGYDPDRTVTVTKNGVADVSEDRLKPLNPDVEGYSLTGASVYPLVYTITKTTGLFNIDLAATARLFLAFNQNPTGLSAVKVEASYDGSSFSVLGYFLSTNVDLVNPSVLLDELTFAQVPKAVRVTLEGTNSPGNNFTLTRLALIHSGSAALENMYLSKRGGTVWGDVNVKPGAKVDGLDLSEHEHDGATGVKIKAPNVLAKPYDGVNYPVNNNGYTLSVQQYLDALQDQLDSLSQGATTLEDLIVKNITITTGGSFTATGIQLNAGSLVTTGEITAGGRLIVTPTSTTDGGEIELRGNNSNPSWFMDVQNANLRFFRNGVVWLQSDVSANNWLFGSNIKVSNGTNEVTLKGDDGGVEIARAGGNAYIDFKDSASEDFDIRLYQDGTNLALNGNFMLPLSKELSWWNGSGFGVKAFTSGDNRLVFTPYSSGWLTDREFGYDHSNNRWFMDNSLYIGQNLFAEWGGLFTNSTLKIHTFGGGAQAVYAGQLRLTPSWANADLADPGSGGLYTYGKAMINASATGLYGSPSVSLAIGDTDSGFNSAGDGLLEGWANNQKVFSWDADKLTAHKQLWYGSTRMLPDFIEALGGNISRFSLGNNWYIYKFRSAWRSAEGAYMDSYVLPNGVQISTVLGVVLYQGTGYVNNLDSFIQLRAISQPTSNSNTLEAYYDIQSSNGTVGNVYAEFTVLVRH